MNQQCRRRCKNIFYLYKKVMKKFHCLSTLCARNVNKRSTTLLLMLGFMLVYIISYDVIYPFEYQSSLLVAENTQSVRQLGVSRGCNASCTGCSFYPVSGLAEDIGFPCVQTKTRPKTTVCLFDEWTDMYISHDLLYTGVWEPHVLRDFVEILAKNRAAGLLDLGANIGFYTLLASKMGHKVISVEPYRESIYRIHRALYLEHLGMNVFVLENGISDRREEVVLRLSGDNQGDHRLDSSPRPCSGPRCRPIVKTIVLDDLCSVIRGNFSSIILKMDIQGYEHRAFKQASNLFSSYDVHYIFMEWFLMAKHFVSSNHTSLDKTLVQDMLIFLFSRDFRPYSLTVDGGKPLDPAKWHLWPFDIIWIRLPNNVEKTSILSTHFRNWPP